MSANIHQYFFQKQMPDKKLCTTWAALGDDRREAFFKRL
jgi:hypothetical protein